MNLAVILIASDINLLRIDKSEEDKRKIFVFEDSEKLQLLIEAYWNKTLRLEPTRLFDELKNLKSRIYES
jgi:hypothetical protein